MRLGMASTSELRRDGSAKGPWARLRRAVFAISSLFTTFRHLAASLAGVRRAVKPAAPQPGMDASAAPQQTLRRAGLRGWLLPLALAATAALLVAGGVSRHPATSALP